tara:strand:+ start:53 stop:253 length:201 start_codon:yes stop_codon:yes gene_type:complete
MTRQYLPWPWLERQASGLSNRRDICGETSDLPCTAIVCAQGGNQLLHDQLIVILIHDYFEILNHSK